MYDVVIAGGGPAGLSAARTAAEHGATACLVEREAAFGIPTRTSGGSFVRDLRELGVEQRLYRVLRAVRFVGPHATAEVDVDGAVCVLDVRALYQWLAERAGLAGVELELRSTVLGCRREDDSVRVRVRAPGGRERELRGRYAVDATGTAAVLAGSTSMHPPFRRRAVGAELDLSAPAYPTDLCHLIVGDDVAPSGYAWAFPYRPGRVRLGTGVIRPDSSADPRALLERLRAHPQLAEVLAGAQPIESHAGIIPVEPLRETIVADRIVCIGDAASHASTLVGEGIRFAMRAGEGAGRAIAASVAGAADAPLRAFEDAWRRRYGRDFRLAYRINLALASFDDERWDRAVSAIGQTPPWFLVRSLSSDFSVMAAIRLGLRRPGLTRRYLAAALTGR